MPEVSVLMSCYNSARWLHDSVSSVLAQTFADFELILVDDGSTDQTPEIMERFGQKDGRVIVVTKQNSGLTRSLNEGIARASGAWIARLDADDICEPTRLETQIDFVRQRPEIVLVGSGFWEVDSADKLIKKQSYPSGHGALVRSLERLQRMFPHSSAIFRLDAAKDAGLYNPLFQKSQDWDLWLRLSERGRISCLTAPLVRVRKHSDQISSSVSGVSQFVYSTGASVCHHLRVRGEHDPSDGKDQGLWQEFLGWISDRLLEEDIEGMHGAWSDLRESYLQSERNAASMISFAGKLMRTGYALRLIGSKVLGTTLPRQLAHEWVTRQCAA